ncbi:hypothetical protein IWW34DRAFT_640344 [Fusarium oxysporum f. sp. albedinis]|uniref:Uncharacterized protein n=3 Tax=Fusarium oxysporum TaxID=5507 RepID=F9F5L0_FUSOF|nr:hypothetical protein FOXB_01685 [Fusarium oxysporum f. sp. conglutinans Fo5176]EXL67039.1 hypothetical protein FOPG_16810 [Fusarium oxysporum f. sp. conglutinans race 2 54008]EXM13363.1 hypothetical protein FOTG_18181 [Fusarium oxysporum f. sp. vasinfectum 25433]KAI3570888.1 hypothetical protein IWW34DRAFT_640344 [Fusarium oxysporum f. sp. albedinis]
MTGGWQLLIHVTREVKTTISHETPGGPKTEIETEPSSVKPEPVRRSLRTFISKL